MLTSWKPNVDEKHLLILVKLSTSYLFNMLCVSMRLKCVCTHGPRVNMFVSTQGPRGIEPQVLCLQGKAQNIVKFGCSATLCLQQLLSMLRHFL